MVDPVSVGLGAGGLVGVLRTQAAAKLVETVSAGLGRAVEPFHIRRKAKAEAEALVTMAQAKVEAREIEIRAAERLLSSEVRRQENIEAIVEAAGKSLPDEVSATRVEPDWASRFFDACKDVSDAEMQSLWGQLLAGEVAEPGTVSMRTLAALQNLTSREALAFESICAASMKLDGQIQLLIFDTEPAALLSIGVGTYNDVLMPLADAGLLRIGALAVQPPAGLPSGLYFDAGEHGKVFVSQSPFPRDGKTFRPPSGVGLGQISLSSVGNELARFVAWAPSKARMMAAIRGWEAFGNNVAVEHFRTNAV